MAWFDDNANKAHIERLRSSLGENHGRVVLFLGAGLSFGASRRGRKGLAERDIWGNRGGAPGDEEVRDTPEIILNDDQEPFPTWSRLKSRMRQQLSDVRDQDQGSLNRFFRSSDPLDCAQLFRNVVGDANYFEFLRTQFKPHSPVDYWITPSHDELVALELPLIFTTNYDDLIERAYGHHGRTLTVSSTADEFLAHLNPHPESHLVKIHGSIDMPSTVVLTRDDYARARLSRRRIYDHLRFDVQQDTYVFIGFSLSDPNVNILLDDARLETGGTMPPSYTVQGRYDRATDEYYRS
ncbi:MAG TPA: SIR2 family protein, partial [Acidimicrobiales bacterium]